MDSIGVRQLRINASEYIRRARDGELFEVTVQGRPTAALVPLEALETPAEPATAPATASNGWRTYPDRDLLAQYWLEPWPTAPDDVIAAGGAHPPNDKISPIYEYRDDGLSRVQWVNLTHDRAAICIADSNWRVGGAYHFWYYPGGGRMPYEFTKFASVHRYPADPIAWQVVCKKAFAEAEDLLGFTS
ncbi:type II toxin-antitoxin system prevent-host-death family antitoxin [Rhodococcus sp. DSM 6344]|nr:type II toxin-antitoxin system prevent-host-death family antitoxin [Rhodococcus erythropolis]